MTEAEEIEQIARETVDCISSTTGSPAWSDLGEPGKSWAIALITSAYLAGARDMKERAEIVCMSVHAETWVNGAEQAGAYACGLAINALPLKDTP